MKEKSTMICIRASTAEELCKKVNEFGKDKKDIFTGEPKPVKEGGYIAFVWYR